ncbi:MAG: PilZ domain-containing protein [Planctomycetota bacterium]
MSTRIEKSSARREFIKINTDVPVRYKFLSKDLDLGADQIFEGTTTCFSGGGLLLQGRIPSMNWIAALLMDKIQLGVNILLPSCDQPIKALCRVSWIEAIPEGSDRCSIGLDFENIEKDMQDQVLKYLIKSQMTK